MSCEVEGCIKPNKPRDPRFCSMHRARWTRHKDTSVVLPAGHYYGPEHASWTGATASYNAVHLRVRASKGPARIHPCSLCGAREAQHWAYDHEDPDERLSREGTYSVDLARYLPMCIRCHKRFDLGWISERRAA